MYIPDIIQKMRKKIHEEDNRFTDLPVSFKGLSAKTQRDLEDRGIHVYHGKVREMLQSSTSQRLFMVHSDRLSAFDKAVAIVPFKGILIKSITQKWFELFSSWGFAHHFLKDINERTLEVKPAKAFKFEVVIRSYLAGSLLRDYQKGVRHHYGLTLPEGLTPYTKLAELIITPTTKADTYAHDIPTDPTQIITSGLCSQTEWDHIALLAKSAFEKSATFLLSHNLILADTKYEFGKDDSGNIFFIDEVHTPDSSRFWNASSLNSRIASNQAPEMHDKENIRRWLISQGFMGEGQVPFVPRIELLNLADSYCGFAKTIGCKLEISGVQNEAECVSEIS